jgi:NADPH2:quinone reductase
MKAVALSREYAPALRDVLLPPPLPPRGRDLLVRIEAVSVNPVDGKQRAATDPATLEVPRVLGWDAAGVVEAIGDEASLFASGDEVYFAGDVTRPGCNAQYQWVDERLVARKPTTLDFAEAAALPLTTLTAWELLFQRMPLQLDDRRHGGQHLLVIGGAGGVDGDPAGPPRRLRGDRHRLARGLDRLVPADGATHVIDHRQPLQPQLQALGIDAVQVALNLADTDHYWDELGQLLAPQGHVGLIVEPRGALRIGDPYKAKCIGIHWEFMFARSRFATADRIEQHRILSRAASMIDAGQLRGTLSETLGTINAANLDIAHQRLASGRTVGKLALVGWGD